MPDSRIAIPLPPSRENRRCVYCDENLFRRRALKCSGCGCVTYCDPTCQHNDWKHHKFQCVYWRARKWHRRLLLDGTPLPEYHVRYILSYAFAPPLRARAIFRVARAMALRTILDRHALPPHSWQSLNQLSETVQRRREKRTAAVQMVKASVEYNLALRREDTLLCQPDPEDITMSKRSWEHAYMKWKHSVRIGSH